MAGGARGIRAGKAYVELGVHDKITAGLRRAQARLKAFGAGIMTLGVKTAALGAGIVAPLLLSVKAFMTMGDELEKMSTRVDASVEFLSALSHAAAIGGTNLNAMEVGIRRMQRSAYDATRGLSTATDAFGALGVNVRDSNGELKSTENLFIETATALSGLENNTLKAALATVVFGRAGTQLLPMLKNGKEGMLGLMKEAEELGIIIGTKDAAASAYLADQLLRVTSVLKMGMLRVGLALEPILSGLADKIIIIGKAVSTWIAANRGLVVSMLKIGGLLVGAGVAMAILGGVLSTVAAGLGVLATVLGALLSPIGLVVAAIVGLGVYIVKATKAGHTALGWLGERFGELRDDALKAYEGIANALKAGDIGLAARILWLTLTMEWLKGKAALISIWMDWKKSFLDLMTNAWYGGLTVSIQAMSALESAWVKTTSFLAGRWIMFTSLLTQLWNITQGALVSGLHTLRGLFDKTFDPEAAKKFSEEMTTAAMQEEKDRRTKLLGKVGTEEAAKLAKVEQDKADTLALIGQKAADAEKQHAEGLSDALTGTQLDLALTKAELDALSKSAKDLASATRGPTPFDELLNKFRDTAGGVAALSKRSVAGTFSGAVASRLGGGGPAERTASATERTAAVTAKLLKIAHKNGLVFW